MTKQSDEFRASIPKGDVMKYDAINSKHEIRNSKQARNYNDQNSKVQFRYLYFEIENYLGFRY